MLGLGVFVIMNDLRYFFQGCTIGFLGVTIKYITLQEFLEKEAMQIVYAFTTIIWFGLARILWKRALNWKSKRTIRAIKLKIASDSFRYLLEEFKNHTEIVVDNRTAIKCNNNAALFELIKNKLEFDELIWGEGDENNPDWVYYSYNPNGNKNQIKICTFDGEAYNYTMIR